MTLNRPQARNAINLSLARELADVLATLDPALVGAVLLSSVGPDFSVGGDLRSFVDAPDGAAPPSGPGPASGMADRVRSTVEAVNEAVLAMAGLPVPVVSALQGWVAGVGVSIGCAADVVIAAESTRFSSAYTKIGFTPDGGLTWLLPRLVGTARSADFVLTNRVVAAGEALAWGLVTRVVPDVDLAQLARGVALGLAAGPPAAQATARRLLRRGQPEELRAALSAEADAVVTQARSAEGGEGVRAFLAKREPRFHPPS